MNKEPLMTQEELEFELMMQTRDYIIEQLEGKKQ